MRWVFRAFKLIVTLSLLAVVALALVPGKKLADVAVARIEALSGRQMALQGDITTKVFPRLSIQTGPVTLSNASWAKSGPMLSAEGLEVGVKILPLLKGDFVFRDIKIVAPKVQLEVAKDGRRNWEFTPSEPQVDGTSVMGSNGVTVDLAQANSARFHYVNHQSGTEKLLTQVDLKARFPDFRGQVDVVGSGFFEGTLFEIDTVVNRPLDLLSNQISTLQVNGKLGGLSYGFDGKFGLVGPVMEGELSVSLTKGSELFEDMSFAKYPLTNEVSFLGSVTRTESGALFVRSGELEIEGHSVSGDLDVTFGRDRPLVKGVLKAQDVDLKPFLSIPASKQSTPLQAWSTDVIDPSRLFVVDAEVAIEAASLDVGALRFGESRIHLALENGRAVFGISKLRAYGGDVIGEFVANGRNGFSVGGDLKAAGIQLSSALGALVGYERFESSADISLNFLGFGNSLSEIINNFSGGGVIDANKSVLRGVDLEEMMLRLDPTYSGTGHETNFDTVNASFTIEKGVLSNNDLAIQTSKMEATGSGSVDLAAQTINYRLEPITLVKDGGLSDVKIPITVTGAWASPVYAMDVDVVGN